MINNREIEILNNLIKGEKYSFNDIALKYNISNRSARYYVDNVDEILKYLGYSKTEKNKNIIKLDTNQDFKKLYDIFNKTQKPTNVKDKFDHYYLDLTELPEIHTIEKDVLDYIK